MSTSSQTVSATRNARGSVTPDLRFPEVPRDAAPTTPFDSIRALDSRHENLRDLPFSMGEVFQNATTIKKFPRSYFRKMKKIRRDTAEFREKYILPNIDEIERRNAADPTYFARDIIDKGVPYRFQTLIIPEGFGGPGYLATHIAIMAEELAVGSGGFATTIAVNMAQLVTLFDPFLFALYAQESLEAERQGRMIIWSGAITEPNAGTDRWDEDFQNGTRADMVATRIDGGYLLNGTKCFTSNGSISERSAISAALDPDNPRDTGCVFVVKTDSPGFTVGHLERKMGQKASVTSEQICEDVFVPDSHRVGVEGNTAKFTTLYLASSRGPVGAIGVGCGRRAMESLVRWASERTNENGRLIDQQALQVTIANMARDLIAARGAYVQACMAFDEVACRLLSHWYVSLAFKLLPKSLLRTEAFRKMAQSEAGRRLYSKAVYWAFPEDKVMHIAGLAANAKVLGSSTGRKVAGEVMRIMGPDAYDPRWGVDRAYRDARLTEIYEGTNQACAITAFKAMAGSFVETLDSEGGC
jgi:alkylation response protein AidB-like acyl-CoA dehydrogenase